MSFLSFLQVHGFQRSRIGRLSNVYRVLIVREAYLPLISPVVKSTMFGLIVQLLSILAAVVSKLRKMSEPFLPRCM